MNERDIRGHVVALKQSMMEGDERSSITAAMTLLEQFLVDVNRMASALEVLASQKVVGEPL